MSAWPPLPPPRRVPAGQLFADASPLRCVPLTPEDTAKFDRQWQEVMARATRELDLTEVLETLEAWRRTAWVTTATGHDRYRVIMRDAERRLRTGERPPGAVSWSQLKVDLGLSE